MKLSYTLLIQLILLLGMDVAKAQNTDANIFGDVKANGEHLPFVSIYVEGTPIGTTTDESGHYMLIDLPEGTHTIIAKLVGYSTEKKEINIKSDQSLEVNFVLEEKTMNLDEVVVTGTKTFKRQIESPVIVNVMENESLEQVQACNISEGLRFQPGLRVETDCQTCNYTQLRMNGLGGSYSQILINGRPIFSPLTGLYGMEQIPANMVERIEVVRGGGSALYGSSAIGGTVNIITRIPRENKYDVDFTTQSINGGALDNILMGNINMVNRKRNAGAAIFVNNRSREAYDHNNDNFSELPLLKNNSFGANLFYKPTADQKLEVNFSSLQEYRYGGEMVDEPAYLAKQSEERTHYVLMGGLDYQINFNDDNSSFIAYAAGQHTDRDHYTGIYPDEEVTIQKHLTNPPYGDTENYTLQAGTQLNHRILDFIQGINTFTIGAEYVFDDVLDTIPAYNYSLDQTTKNLGFFVQSDWSFNEHLTLLTGVRLDKHNLLDHIVASPRVSLLYRYKANTQFRLSWGTGFRAPQAFDADMHIAFAGGGISRIILAPDLKEERSNSYSASINYDKPSENFIYGFTLEGFYTELNNAFYLQPIGEDQFGDLFQKRNGPGATVRGITIELRANYDRKIQLESGFTYQKSTYKEAVEHISEMEPQKRFLRTPDNYGYFTLSFMPNKQFNASVSGVYTGSMLMTHFAGAPEHQFDEYVTTPTFMEVNLKASYTFDLTNLNSGLEIFAGVKNLFNEYQDDFDTGKNRDSNYIYGPGLPRTIFVGIGLKSL